MGLAVLFTPVFPNRLSRYWGLNKTVGWAWDITNFGLVGRYWSRRNIESPRYYYCLGRNGEWLLTVLLRRLTYSSVIQAGLFSIIHMGRPWLAYWVIALYQNQIWINCG